MWFKKISVISAHESRFSFLICYAQRGEQSSFPDIYRLLRTVCVHRIVLHLLKHLKTEEHFKTGNNNNRGQHQNGYRCFLQDDLSNIYIFFFSSPYALFSVLFLIYLFFCPLVQVQALKKIAFAATMSSPDERTATKKSKKQSFAKNGQTTLQRPPQDSIRSRFYHIVLYAVQRI